MMKIGQVMHGGKVELLREGTWLYDGCVRCRVRILREDWDKDYSEAEDEDNEAPFRTAYYAQFEIVAARGSLVAGCVGR